jgi:two-component system, OmpR family, KDP operon response regulator KdpE
VAKVLAVDDEAQILMALARALPQFGHEVIVARNARDGLAAAAAATPEVVLLDLRLPDLDGIEVVRRLRSWSGVPVILLSGDGSDRVRSAALDAGADDFVDKPFSMDVLRARIAAVLRRAGGSNGDPRPAGRDSRQIFGDLTIDLCDRSIAVAGIAVRLSPTQWRLLETLVTHPGRVLTYPMIIAAVWTEQHGNEAREALRVHLRSLRRRLGDDASKPRYIATEPGVGYRWIAHLQSEAPPPPDGGG